MGDGGFELLGGPRPEPRLDLSSRVVEEIRFRLDAYSVLFEDLARVIDVRLGFGLWLGRGRGHRGVSRLYVCFRDIGNR